MTGEALRRQLDYYKHHLDELAGQRLSIEHHQWSLHMQLRQKRNGIQLLSQLARSFGADTDLASMFRIAVLAINSALEMDRTAIFVRREGTSSYTPAHFAGLSQADSERLADQAFEFPADLADGSALLLVDSSSKPSPFIARLREAFAVETFICVPVMGHCQPLGIIFSGRLGSPSLLRAVCAEDADTLRAICAILQAVTQHARLALLEQTERVKSEFYADVAHEFRTPLTLTLGPLEQILSGKWGALPPPIRDRLRVVERNQERLLGLINQILDLARFEAGAAELRIQSIADINGMVSECVAYFRPAAEARGLQVKLSLDPALGARPFGADRGKLERALINLLSNALKFTDQGQIEVRTSSRDERLVLSVADTGIGIPDEDLPHIFDRFRKAASSAPRRERGSGIGLALVKQMVEIHHGQIVVESCKGKGTRFTMTLPSHDVEATASPSVDRSHLLRLAELALAGLPDLPRQTGLGDEGTNVIVMNRSAEAAFDPSKKIVLYVEDDADLRGHVRDCLADIYNVFVAGDGAEGLENAQRYCPDAIVTDQMMPQMSGQQLLGALRSDPELSRIPVLFLTAQHGTEGRIECLDAGADDYTSKPFHQAELRARIGNLIRARSGERELAELNRRLQMQVREQISELMKAGELQKFLPRPVIANVLGAPDGRPQGPSLRQVTVVVADLSILAAFSESAQVQAAAPIVNEFLAAIAAICAAQGGIIDGLTGASVSVLFGAVDQASPEQTAWSAIQAAFEIRRKMQGLMADVRRRGLSYEQQSGIGLASGACAVGSFGGDSFKAFTAIGSPAHTAARLQACAAPSSILSDEASQVLLRTRVHSNLITGEAWLSRQVVPRYEITAMMLSSSEPAHRETAPPLAPAPVSQADCVFVREGEFWTVVFRGAVFRLRESKGALYLAHLLARPHEEVHVLELSQASSGSDERRTVSVREAAELGLRSTRGTDGNAPFLDPQAKLAYRERLRALDEQLIEAEQFADGERALRIRAEQESLGRELANALGLGGRDRQGFTVAERCRVNVTRTVKSVVQKISQAHPALGRHLAMSVRTGVFCSYAPQPGDPETWHVAW